MGGPRCPRCDRGKGRRCHRDGALEQALSGVYIYPFRCSLCGHRFRALAWGRRYVRQSADRREWDPVAVRAPVVLRTGDASAAGEATALSFQGFTVKTAARLVEGATVSVKLDLVAGEPPIEVEEAVVRTMRSDGMGFQFVRLQPEEERRLRRVVVGLFARGRDATVPPGPTLQREGRLRMLWSADVWLVVLVVTLIVLAWLWLSPWVVRCVYGVNC